jgi:hypothetical protein
MPIEPAQQGSVLKTVQNGQSLAGHAFGHPLFSFQSIFDFKLFLPSDIG